MLKQEKSFKQTKTFEERLDETRFNLKFNPELVFVILEPKQKSTKGPQY
jgi:hypothetical protein